MGTSENATPKTKRMITVGPYIDRAGLDCLGPPESIIRVKDWAEALELLRRRIVLGRGWLLSLMLPSSISQSLQAHSGIDYQFFLPACSILQ